jgi:DNA-binding NtrC family response regulator
MPNPTVLLVSEEETLTRKVDTVVASIHALAFQHCRTVTEACSELEQDTTALILIHLTSGTDEAELASLLQATGTSRRPCPTLVLADNYQDQQAIALLRAGVADYLRLPEDLSKLPYLLDVLTLRARPVERPPLPPPPRPVRDPSFYVLAPEMVELMEQVRRVVPQETTLLLTGETGTGKTRLARLIHELSPRRDEPFLVVDCGALSSSLIESEIFGHIRGAFTGAERDRPGKFAAAGRGTLLLDEINALPLHLQAKLLRAVDERVFEPVGSNKSEPLHARLIAASNMPLDGEVAAGRFRSDLYYRLNVVGFYLPPLRARRSAIGPLINKLLAEFASRNRPDIVGLSREALRILVEYDWPGNVRELRNVLERAIALSPGPTIEPGDLPEAIRSPVPRDARPDAVVSSNGTGSSSVPGTLDQTKEEAEIRRIQQALEKHRNNRLRAAAELGISRMALYKKLHRYGLIHATGAAP